MSDAVRPTVPCAFDGCHMGAVTRVREKTGWTHLCRTHYETQHQAEARAYAAKHNLKTPADHLAHIKALLANPKVHSARAHWERVRRESPSALAQQYADDRLRRYGSREPGEDDE